MAIDGHRKCSKTVCEVEKDGVIALPTELDEQGELVRAAVFTIPQAFSQLIWSHRRGSPTAGFSSIIPEPFEI